MHSTIQKTAAPSWDEIKNSISEGWGKAKGALPAGAEKFLNENGGNVANGMAGAAIGGGLYGLTASRRSYESEEEFRGRRFRGALQTAALTGTMGALAKPIQGWIKEDLPKFRQDLNQKAVETSVMKDPTLPYGNHRKQKMEQVGGDISKVPDGPITDEAKPLWMTAGEVGAKGTELTGQYGGTAVGAAAGWKASGGLAKGIFEGLDPEEAKLRGESLVKIQKHKATFPREGFKLRNFRVGISPSTNKPWAQFQNTPSTLDPKYQRSIRNLDLKRLGHTIGRGAIRGTVATGGGALGGYAGGIGGKWLGNKMIDGLYAFNGLDRNWVDPSQSAAALAVPQAPALP